MRETVRLLGGMIVYIFLGAVSIGLFVETVVIFETYLMICFIKLDTLLVVLMNIVKFYCHIKVKEVKVKVLFL